MMQFLRAAALAGLAALCVGCAPLRPGALRVSCEAADRSAYSASATRFGDAVLTAGHVAERCYAETSTLSATDDLAILAHGRPPICQDAGAGEPLTLWGYPSGELDLFGAPRRDLEFRAGVAEAIEVFVARRGPLLAIHAPGVRSGYSGGPVRASDGRLVGVISGISARDPARVYAVPVSTVCDFLKAGNEPPAR